MFRPINIYVIRRQRWEQRCGNKTILKDLFIHLNLSVLFIPAFSPAFLRQVLRTSLFWSWSEITTKRWTQEEERRTKSRSTTFCSKLRCGHTILATATIVGKGTQNLTTTATHLFTSRGETVRISWLTFDHAFWRRRRRSTLSTESRRICISYDHSVCNPEDFMVEGLLEDTLYGNLPIVSANKENIRKWMLMAHRDLMKHGGFTPFIYLS